MCAQQNSSDRNKNSEVRADVCPGEESTPGQWVWVRRQTVEKECVRKKRGVTAVGRRKREEQLNREGGRGRRKEKEIRVRQTGDIERKHMV